MAHPQVCCKLYGNPGLYAATPETGPRRGLLIAVSARAGAGLLPVAPNPLKPHMRMRLWTPLGPLF